MTHDQKLHTRFTYLACPVVIGGVPKLDNVKGDVFVERVEDCLGYPGVEPRPVNKEEPRQEPELGDGEVGTVDSLHSFVSGDAHTHVGFLNHGHVIGPIPD